MGDFEDFIDCLKKAGKNMKDEHYFQLEVAESEDYFFRERVYCYELYHHLRNVLAEDFPYKLDGEVDKGGHPIIHSYQPDFIVHKPGNMKNLAVIEVKPLTVKNHLKRLDHDLRKLKYFRCDDPDYKYPIMLIYGDGRSELSKKIISRISKFGEKILLLWHSGPGKELKSVINQE